MDGDDFKQTANTFILMLKILLSLSRFSPPLSPSPVSYVSLFTNVSSLKYINGTKYILETTFAAQFCGKIGRFDILPPCEINGNTLMVASRIFTNWSVWQDDAEWRHYKKKLACAIMAKGRSRWFTVTGV